MVSPSLGTRGRASLDAMRVEKAIDDFEHGALLGGREFGQAALSSDPGIQGDA
jgi:hypothetical protein